MEKITNPVSIYLYIHFLFPNLLNKQVGRGKIRSGGSGGATHDAQPNNEAYFRPTHSCRLGAEL